MPSAAQPTNRVEVGYNRQIWLLGGCVFCFLKGDVKLGFVLSERRGPRRVCGLLHTFIGLHQSG